MLSVRNLICALVALFMLVACGSRPMATATPASDAMADLTGSIKRIAPSTLPLMTTPGTWVRPPKGPLFEPIDTLDPRHAMIYVYRPSTSWEDQELQAPSFFVNGRKVFGLKSGSYTWMEIHAGNYQFYAKRPLSILFIKKIFELDIKLQGGRTYYLRYSEDAPFDYAGEGLNPKDFQQAGYLQEVPESIALVEIASLRMDHPGLYFAGGRVTQPRWTPFESFPETGVVADRYADEEPPPEKAGLWSRTRSFFGNLF